MPVNPMQRRIRNSFLGGFCVAVIIMAVVVMLLIFKMKSMQDENAKLLGMQQTVLVAAENLESGETITIDSFMMQKVQTTVDPAEVITEDDFLFYDEEGNVQTKLNKDGSEKQKEMIIKIDVPAGTIVTKDMVAESKSDISDDLRLQEYNMITFPTQLEVGEFIDIRLQMPRIYRLCMLIHFLILET